VKAQALERLTRHCVVDFLVCFQEVDTWPTGDECSVLGWDLRHGDGSKVAMAWPGPLAHLVRRQYISTERCNSIVFAGVAGCPSSGARIFSGLMARALIC